MPPREIEPKQQPTRQGFNRAGREQSICGKGREPQPRSVLAFPAPQKQANPEHRLAKTAFEQARLTADFPDHADSERRPIRVNPRHPRSHFGTCSDPFHPQPNRAPGATGRAARAEPRAMRKHGYGFTSSARIRANPCPSAAKSLSSYPVSRGFRSHCALPQTAPIVTFGVRFLDCFAMS
jgi:hypothetical protein